MAVKTTLRENISIALQSIGGNKLRTVLTALIISIGIMALIGIQTAIEGIKQKTNDAFAGLGANSFTIQNMGVNLNFGPGGQMKQYPPISYDQAVQFRKNFKLPVSISINLDVTGNAIAKYGNEKTNPNITVKGTNENYLLTGGYKLAAGRNFSSSELESGDNVVIIGEEIKENLFKDKDAVNKSMFIGDDKFRVIGVLASKGSGSQFGGDKVCLIPVFKAKQIINNSKPTFNIVVTVNQPEAVTATVDEATALFRNIRGLNVAQPENFEIFRSDSIQKQLDSQIGGLSVGGMVIGIITLIGAAIGLMNIMLVSVTERTREIGLRKSIGATPAVIRKQFLIEAIVICLIGGAGGIVLGIGIGNLVILAMEGSFAVPWVWLIVAIVLCTLIGMISGYYPAKKAARLDPVEALRYE
ncbi:FtsX-like permease family protein [Mucilaginibacter limnophilus]|uniref:FtsX-like permease family protein n=1 Tax=Mucilaginibacter limnophilus TaxID=1932778 RepID=A0A437MKT2_9SPHI|nr:ABC transporter permease [Mucilaginibacter limnophilus]RVT98268.1 FtsX-like permease family protein [Mucilaginibacter limnophilus]